MNNWIKVRSLMCLVKINGYWLLRSHKLRTLQIMLNFLDCSSVLLWVVACLLVVYNSCLLVSSSAGRVLNPRLLLLFVLWRDSRVLAAGVTAELLTPQKYWRAVFTSKTWPASFQGAADVVVVEPLEAISTSASFKLHFSWWILA
jgi:hypothetical protein